MELARVQRVVLATFGLGLCALFVWSGLTPGVGFEPLEAAALVLFIGPWFGYRLLEDRLSPFWEGAGFLALLALWNGIVVVHPEASLSGFDARYYLALAGGTALGLLLVYRGTLGRSRAGD